MTEENSGARAVAWAQRLGAGFDAAALERLIALDPDESTGLMPQLVALFEESLRVQTQALEAALAAVDLDALRRAAHSVRSAAMSMGALEFAQACTALEQQALLQQRSAASHTDGAVFKDGAALLQWALALREQVRRTMAAHGDEGAHGHGRN